MRARPATGGSGSTPVVLVAAVFAALLLVAFLASRGDGSLPDGVGARALTLVSTPAPESRPAVAAPSATARPAGANEAPPRISGYAAAVLEEPCGAVLFGQNHHLRLPPASLTKMMTAIVAYEHGDLDEVYDIEIDGGAVSLETDSTVMGLKPGQRLTLRDLLYGLMLRSGYDAAITIADGIAGSEEEFVAMMNARVAELGLNGTHFTNPHGLDNVSHYSSAYDVAVIGSALLAVPELAEIVATQEYTPFGWTDGPLENINFLLTTYPGAIGIKTGFTDQAGQTIVGAARRDGRTLIVSVMRSEDLYADAGALLDWAFENTEPACGSTDAVAEAIR